MAVRFLAAATCVAALAGGCVIREIREIRTEPGLSNRAPSCSSTAAVPGSVLADSQPPSPMVEEAGEPPGQDYVWVDGYWHWDGAEWIWMSGRWVAPMDDFVFVPPSYYSSGTACVYVPGYWQRGPRSPWPIRDHRPISIGGHSHHHPRPVSHKPPHHIGDHRGDKPTGKPGSLAGVGDDQDEVVVTIPDRPRPVPAAPSKATAPPSSPTWHPPGASSPPPSAPARPSAPPPPQARPAPPPPPPRAPPSPGPARVAPPSAPARTAPPAPSPPPKPAAPPKPSQSSPAGGNHKK